MLKYTDNLSLGILILTINNVIIFLNTQPNACQYCRMKHYIYELLRFFCIILIIIIIIKKATLRIDSPSWNQFAN